MDDTQISCIVPPSPFEYVLCTLMMSFQSTDIHTMINTGTHSCAHAHARLALRFAVATVEVTVDGQGFTQNSNRFQIRSDGRECWSEGGAVKGARTLTHKQPQTH